MNRFRRQRFRLFVQLLGVTPATRILDVGGAPKYWEEYSFPAHVTCVNLNPDIPEGRHGAGNIVHVKANAADLPFCDRSFDVVFSNSLVEHVGADKQATVATEIRRVGNSYWVQVPCRHFFIEPHFRALFFWQFPAPVRRFIARYWTALVTRHNYYLPEVDTMHLLDKEEMRLLFPDARILPETFLGMTKSLIAYRT